MRVFPYSPRRSFGPMLIGLTSLVVACGPATPATPAQPTQASTSAPQPAATTAPAPTLAPTRAAAAPTTAAAAATTPGAATPRDGGTLRIALVANLVTLDPTVALDNYSQQVVDQVFDTLVSFGPDGSIEPRLATSWSTSDATVWDFKIRQGVKFHNGRSMTADDVVWTMQRMLDPSTKVPRQHLFMVNTVEKTADDAVRFTLKQAYAPFLSVLANRGLSIEPKEVVEERGQDFARNPVGTGPFKFVSWNQNDGVILERNPDYFFGKPHLDRVIMKPVPETTVAQQSLETGDYEVIADAVPDDIDRLTKAGLLQLVPGGSYSYLVFNLHPDNAPITKTLGKNPFLDKRVREALALSFPVDDAIKAVYPTLTDQIRAYSIIPNWSWAYNGDLKAQAQKPDVNRAKQLLAEAGYPKGFDASMTIVGDAARKAMAQIFQNSASKIGVKVSIEAPDLAIVLQKANEQTFDIGLFGWGGTPDPQDYVLPLLHTSRRGPGGNNAYYSNPDVDKLIDDAGSTSDQNARVADYKQIQAIFAGEFAHIPLYFKPAVLGTSKKVHDMKIDPFNFFRIVKQDANVWLDQ